MQPTLWDFAPTKTTARKPKNPSRKATAARDCRGTGCTLDGMPAFIRPMGETMAVIEPVSLDQEPSYVNWEDVAATMDNGGKFFTPRN